MSDAASLAPPLSADASDAAGGCPGGDKSSQTWAVTGAQGQEVMRVLP